MKDQNPLNHMTAREQAKLEDFVRKDLGGSSASTSQPANQVPADSGVVNQAELTHDLKQKQRDQVKKLNPLTPSVVDPNEAAPPDSTLGAAVRDDALDVDMFARGDVNKVVGELREKKIEDEVREQAKQAGLPFVRLIGYPISPEVLAIVPTEMVRNQGVVAYLRAGHKVRLAVTKPNDAATKQAIETLRANTPYEYLVATIAPDSYRYALKLYDELPALSRQTDDVQINKSDKKSFEQDIKNLLDLRTKIKDVPTSKLVDILLTGAVKIGASDIHIEPTEQGVRFRYRLDGVLQTVAELPAQITNPILSRLKFLAKLKIDVNRMPQDGRFTIKDDSTGENHEIDIRVATIPVQYGEAVTMRLLDRSDLSLTIDSLGLTGEAHADVLKAISRPQGLVLECGPTGSGKTTTLYSLLSIMNDPGKKVITLEDPIEYRLTGVMQSQVQSEHGYDFAQGFRSILRLDPDIVMVGEIRDEETAEMGTQAALTGHIVLSTLHTNDAPTAIPRLLDLGVRPFLLSHAVNVVMAQRLVRKVCPHCAEEYAPEATALSAIKQRLSTVPAKHREAIPPQKDWLFMRGKGCQQCNNTGFAGRIGIFEVLVPNDELEELALNRAPVNQLKQAAVKNGMMTMEQDGLIKAVTGVTTVDEVWRVARNL